MYCGWLASGATWHAAVSPADDAGIRASCGAGDNAQAARETTKRMIRTLRATRYIGSGPVDDGARRAMYEIENPVSLPSITGRSLSEFQVQRHAVVARPFPVDRVSRHHAGLAVTECLVEVLGTAATPSAEREQRSPSPARLLVQRCDELPAD